MAIYQKIEIACSAQQTRQIHMGLPSAIANSFRSKPADQAHQRMMLPGASRLDAMDEPVLFWSGGLPGTEDQCEHLPGHPKAVLAKENPRHADRHDERGQHRQEGDEENDLRC